MNYIELLNQFWQTGRKIRVSPNEAYLYFFLLNESNSRMWENPFECTNGLICATIGMTEKTLIDVRNRLVKKGLISVEAGQRKKKSPVYTLLYCNKVSINVSKEVSITVSKTVSKNRNIINKQNKEENKKDNNKKSKIKPTSLVPTKNEVIDYFFSIKDSPSEAEKLANSFYSHFSENDWSNGKSILFDWIREADEWQGEPEKEKEPALIYPYDSKEFLDKWSTLVQSPKWRKKQHKTLQMALDKLKDFDEEYSIELIDRAIIGEYQGLVFSNTKTDYENYKSGKGKKLNITNHDNRKNYDKF